MSSYNNNKWNAAVAYIRNPKHSISKLANTYGVAPSTVIYALKALANPTYKGNMRQLHNSQHIQFFRYDFKDRSYENIAKLFKAAKTPYPSHLKHSLKENTWVKTTATPNTTSNKPFKRCKECGTAIITNAKFCYACGKPVTISADKVIEICDCLKEAVHYLKPSDKGTTTWLNSIDAIIDFAQEVKDAEEENNKERC